MIILKTLLLDSKTRDLVLYHILEEEKKASLVNQKMMPFRAWLNQYLDPELSTNSQTMILYKTLHQQIDNFPIYGKMFHYPQFIEQIVQFSRKLHHCIIFNKFLPSPFSGNIIDYLPCSTPSEIELKQLLHLCLNNEMIFPTHGELDIAFTSFDNLVVLNGFYTDIFDYLVATSSTKKGLETMELPTIQEPTITYRHALNPRNEVEAIAQEIISNGLLAEDILIIPFDSSYSDLLTQVFNQYQIPHGFVSRSELSSCFLCAHALFQCYIKQDINSLIHAIEVNALPVTCNQGTRHFIDQFIQSLDDLIPSHRVNHPSLELLSERERRILEKDEADYNAFIESVTPFISSLKSNLSLREIADEVFNQCVSLFDSKHTQDLYELKAYLEDIYQYIETLEDLELVLYQTKGKTMNSTSSCLGRVAISDPTHPIPCRKVAYILGASQKSYPGFTPESGVFDESYCAKTPYPTMQYRFEAYTTQLEWIKKCAHTIHFTFPLLDYQGKKSEAAFELEGLVDKVSEIHCVLSDNEMNEKHLLQPELANALYLKDGRLHGSVSSFETYFNCPYAYFLKSGLRIDDFSYTALESNTIGTIQHAILETACRTKGKKYSKITQDEMESIAQPYYNYLVSLLPKNKNRIDIIYSKMIHNLVTSFEFLDEMESNTSFEPNQFEYKFESTFFDHITLRGVIDRIDTSYDLLRILDYKSSDKTLSETSIKAGLQLQLCTYLIIANSLFNKHAIGAYYYSLKNENISLPSILESKEVFSDWNDDDTHREYIKSNQLSGWTLEELDTIDYTGTHIKYLRPTKNGISFTLFDETTIETCIRELYEMLYEKVTGGQINVDPVENACTYCKYRTICRFKGQQKKPSALVLQDTSLKKGRDVDEVE